MSRNSPENQNHTQKIPKNKKPVLELNKTAAERARRSINTFVSAINPQFDWSPFHNTYYQLLQKFAEGTIQRLIISVPPQHGKSLGASVFLPAFMLGKNPNLKITVVSYSLALARRFAAQIQRIIDDENYHNIFPHTQLKNASSQNPKNKSARRTAHEFDCVGHDGGLRSVGRTGSLTGNTVDLLILDDLYKDALEANSPLIRERVWEWYNAVARTRLHNTAQELIVETRWHEDDIIGRLKKCENVVELTSWEQLDRPKPDTWFALSFEALKTSPPSQLDPRKPGEALWPKKHSVQWLKQRRKADPNLFEALFQGNPEPREGRLYETFQTYRKLPQNPLKRANYTDTADTGNDKLCSICYLTDENGLCYITDVVYTDLAMELTETAVRRCSNETKRHKPASKATTEDGDSAEPSRKTSSLKGTEPVPSNSSTKRPTKNPVSSLTPLRCKNSSECRKTGKYGGLNLRLTSKPSNESFEPTRTTMLPMH